MKLYQYTLHGWVNPADVFVSLFATDTHAFWFDREKHFSKRVSVMGHAYGQAVVSLEAVETALGGSFDSEVETEFVPGFVGWVEYPSIPSAEYSAESSFLSVREALVFNHDKRQVSLVGFFDAQADFDHWVQAILLRLALVGGEQASFKHRNKPGQVSSVSVRHSRAEYLALIRQAQQHIAQGDVYQLCLTNEIRLTAEVSPLEVFLRLRQVNAAPYSSFIRIGERVLVSSSPEQFLSVSDSGRVQTKPIKGTRPRSSDSVKDLELAEELRSSEKERAENLMIVDLMRNDLSKFCVETSVQVDALFEVESYPSVHQLVSTVSGQLAPDENAVSAIHAAFPGGSMTGAPKLRAQELIAQLEGELRGVYSGVSGSISLNGELELAMNIRCLVFEGSEITIGVGGGITSDSNPEAEFEEIQLKAQAMLSVLGAQVVW